MTESERFVIGTLSLVDLAHQKLAMLRTLPELEAIRDRVDAWAEIAKIARQGLETQNYVAQLKIKCERRIGEILGEMFPHGGDRKSSRKRTQLEKPPYKPWQMTVLRKVAGIPEGEFIAYCHTCNDAGVELTTVGLLKHWADMNRKPKDGEEVPKEVKPAPGENGKPEPPDPLAEILAAMTQLTRKLTVFINSHGDGEKFRKYLEVCELGGWLDNRDITVRLDDGTTKTFPVRFRGFAALRWFLRLAGKKGTRPPNVLRAEFKEATKTDVGDWQGDA